MTNLLEKNLLALQAHQPEVVEHLLAADPDSAMQAARGDDGSLILFRKSDGKNVLLSHPQQAQAKAEQFVEQKKDLLAGNEPLFFVGMRAGYEIRAFFARLERKDWQAPRALYVLEPSFDVLRLNLLAENWTELIATGQLYFFVGPDAFAHCRDFFLGDLAKPQPSQVLPLAHADTVRQVVAMLGQVKATYLKQATAHKKELDEYYDALSPLDLARAYLDPPSLKMLLISNRLSYFIQYSIRDIRTALEKLGVTVEVLEEQAVVDRLTGPLLLQTLHRFRPHGLIFIDHLRSEYGDIYPRGLPFFSWIQDFMQSIHNEEPAKKVTDRDLIVGYIKGLSSFGYPPEQLFALPPLTNPDLFAAERGDPPEHFRSELSFVSNVSRAHEKAYDHLQAVYRKKDPQRLPVLEAVYRQATELYDKGEMFADYEQFYNFVRAELNAHQLPVEPLGPFVFQLYDDLIAPMIRSQALEWAARTGHELALYGRGWDDHPRLSPHARGIVANGPDLVDVYRGTTINLHVNQFEIEHQRIIDGIMAGGFFLVRKMPSLGLLDMDECLFTTEQELREKIDTFLAHPDQRREIVERNQAIIRRWATYEAGAKAFLTYFGLQQLNEAPAVVSQKIESLTAKQTNDLLARLETCAERFPDDPLRFGFSAVLTALDAAGLLDAEAAGPIENLDAFQQRFGGIIWPWRPPHPLRDSFVKAVEKKLAEADICLPIAIRILFESWRENEGRDALFYRCLQNDLDTVGEADARTNCDPSTWPDCRQQRTAESIAKYRQMQMLFLPITEKWAEKRVTAIRLMKKGEPGGAYRQMMNIPPECFTHYTRLIELMLLPTSGYCDNIGDSENALALYDRLQSMTLQKGSIDTRLASLLHTFRAQVIAFAGRLDEAAKEINQAKKHDETLVPFQVVAGRLHLLNREWKKAAAVLKQADSISDPDFRCLAIDMRDVAQAMTKGKLPNAMTAAEHVSLLKTVPIPTRTGGIHRIARMRALGRDKLFLRTFAPEENLFLFHFDSGEMKPATDLHPALQQAGPYPVFDVFENHLYIVDSEKPALMKFNEDLEFLTTYPMPPEARFYIEDLVVISAKQWVWIDAFRDCLKLTSSDGESQMLSAPGSDPDLPQRVARCGEGFVFYSGGHVHFFNREGKLTRSTELPLSMPALYGSEDRVYCASGFPPRLTCFDENGSELFTWRATPNFIPLSIAAVAGNETALILADDRRCRFLRLAVR